MNLREIDFKMNGREKGLFLDRDGYIEIVGKFNHIHPTNTLGITYKTAQELIDDVDPILS